MTQFKCKRCGNLHNIVTLIEFPKPDIISRITSGELKLHLYTLGKNFYVIEKSRAILECELVIDIHDFDDELEILVWVEVSRKEIQQKMKAAGEISELALEGKLYYELPFYQNSKNSPVQISINLDGAYGDLPVVKKILKKHELQSDFNNGIEFSVFTDLLCDLYHSVKN